MSDRIDSFLDDDDINLLCEDVLLDDTIDNNFNNNTALNYVPQFRLFLLSGLPQNTSYRWIKTGTRGQEQGGKEH